MNQLKSFVCVGAGNVATHLVRELCKSGFKLLQVYSRTGPSARILADTCNAGYTTSLHGINPSADFYMVSIPDQFLPAILSELKIHDKLVFHTAGSVGLEVFGNKFNHCGVIYPLQTFSKNADLNLAEVPFLVEAGNKESLQEIIEIAGKLSEKVLVMDAETRKVVHLAAVFACNFTNHMYEISYDILKQKNIEPVILRPIIEETFNKLLRSDPSEAQTGPAVRNDFDTMDKHIKMLENQSLLQKIYTFTSQSIQITKSLKQNKPVNE